MSKSETNVAHMLSLHRQPAAPPPIELTLINAPGFAATPDGAQCVVRTITAEGTEVRLILAPEVAQSLVNALTAAMAQAGANIDGGKQGARIPDKWEVATAPGFAGVIVAFDRGTRSQAMFGIGSPEAREMGRALIAQAQQVQSRPTIITPDRPALIA